MLHLFFSKAQSSVYLVQNTHIYLLLLSFALKNHFSNLSKQCDIFLSSIIIRTQASFWSCIYIYIYITPLIDLSITHTKRSKKANSNLIYGKNSSQKKKNIQMDTSPFHPDKGVKIKLAFPTFSFIRNTLPFQILQLFSPCCWIKWFRMLEITIIQFSLSNLFTSKECCTISSVSKKKIPRENEQNQTEITIYIISLSHRIYWRHFIVKGARAVCL